MLEETKKKISQSLKGRKMSLETRLKISESLTGKKRGKHSPELKAKLSLLRKGKKHSSHWKISEEGKRKISEAQKSRKRTVSLETRQKLSKIGKGKVITQECREKLSEKTSQAHKLGKFRNVNTSKRFKQGMFFSNKNNKEIHYRSSWELQVYQILEQISKVKFYESEAMSIEYFDENKKKRGYRPDILITYIDNSKDLIEVKPKSHIALTSNILKFEAGRKYASENNMNFFVITEKQIKKKQVLL
jgi:hypothetical protein